ncbi:MAG: hypothetical protein QM820_23045 [Minicystis sp.]
MASPSRARAVVIASGILLATPAAAQDSPPPQKAEQDKQPATPPPPPARPMSQQPAAVQPLGPRRAPRGGPAHHAKGKRGQKAQPPATGAPIVGAPNFFRLDDGLTRISVEVSAKTDVAEGRAQGRLTYRIRAAFVAERVNLLPLLTGWFHTPVDRAQLSQDGQDVILTIDLRDAATPAVHRVVETPRGIVLQVDFPPVAGADKAAEPQESSRERAKRRTSTQTLSGGNERHDD